MRHEKWGGWYGVKIGIDYAVYDGGRSHNFIWGDLATLVDPILGNRLLVHGGTSYVRTHTRRKLKLQLAAVGE